MYKIRFCVSVCYLFVLCACGTSSSTLSEALLALQGDWETECLAEGVTTDSLRFAITIDSTAYNAHIYKYKNSGCINSTEHWDLRGTLSVGSLISTQTAVREIDFSNSSVALTLLSPSVVSAATANRRCGRTDWSIDIASDVSVSICRNTEWMARSPFSLYGFAGGALYFGSNSTSATDGTTSPTRLDTLMDAAFTTTSRR